MSQVGNAHLLSLFSTFEHIREIADVFSDLTRDLNVGFSADTVYRRSFKLCMINNLAWGLAVHTRCDDIELISRSQVHQNHKQQIVVRFLSTFI